MVFASAPSYNPLLYIGIVIGLALLIFLFIRKRKHLSGKLGEQKVSRLLESLKNESEFVINDFMVSKNQYNTDSIQIDHIFISHKGIFVIETKDYKGRIYGDGSQKTWTQVLAYGKVKNSLYNPIKQNLTHSKYIYKITKEQFDVYNCVIFVDGDLSRVTNIQSQVFYPRQFKYFYKNLKPRTEISKENLVLIFQEIKSIQEQHQITKKEHITNVKRKKELKYARR